MKYNAGDKVRIKSIDWYNENKNECNHIYFGNHVFCDLMSKYCSEVFTISNVYSDFYFMNDNGFEWTDEMIEGLVEEETKPNIIEEAKTYWDSIKDAWICPQGYQFVDENGNIINAQKIVLEKKKKDVNLAQEQINKMVHDSCVLFCKHCGCGIPRDTCTSLGTCKEHDEYRDAIRALLTEKKKKEYPKTYKECCEVLDWNHRDYDRVGYESELLCKFQVLLLCRDAYWRIAGEEMGLEKPWEPDWRDNYQKKWTINFYQDEINLTNGPNVQFVLAFPTEEMRDTFYENFKELIEICKELL